MLISIININSKEKYIPNIKMQPTLITPLYELHDTKKNFPILKISGNNILLQFTINYHWSEENNVEVIDSKFYLSQTNIVLKRYIKKNKYQEFDNRIHSPDIIKLPISNSTERKNFFGLNISNELTTPLEKEYGRGMQLITIFSDFPNDINELSELQTLISNFGSFLELSYLKNCDSFAYQFNVKLKKKSDEENFEHISTSLFKFDFNKEGEVKLILIENNNDYYLI